MYFALFYYSPHGKSYTSGWRYQVPSKQRSLKETWLHFEHLHTAWPVGKAWLSNGLQSVKRPELIDGLKHWAALGDRPARFQKGIRFLQILEAWICYLELVGRASIFSSSSPQCTVFVHLTPASSYYSLPVCSRTLQTLQLLHTLPFSPGQKLTENRRQH